MVQLSSETANKHPFFEDYLLKKFIHVASKPRIMKAFWKWSAFDDTVPPRNFFFKYGYPPEIGVRAMTCKYTDSDPQHGTGGYGALLGIDFGRTWDKDGINVMGGLVGLVEDVTRRAGVGKSKDDDNLILDVMEATILHEMVHWSYFYEDVDEAKKYGGDQEFGTHSFERAAYGHIMSLNPHLFCYEVEKVVPTLGYREDKTYTIVDLLPGSPAKQAGLKIGDVLLTFDGQKYSTVDTAAELAKKKPHDQISVDVRRNNSVITLKIILPSRSDPLVLADFDD